MKTILVDAVNTLINEGQGVFTEMHELLETFPNQKIILTNANDEQMIQFGLDKAPYQVFSLKHNPDKTDPKYYEIMLETLKLNKEEVVYFEHSGQAVASARSQGINTYHYDPEKKDLVALEVFLRENAGAK